MKRLNLRLLEVFRTVVETRSVTVAADRLGVTQPAVSKALAEFEQDAGLSLFGRQGRRLIPTADAARLYDETSRLFAHVSVFRDRVDDLRSGKAGQLSIAAIPTLAASLVVQTAMGLMEKVPGLNVKVVASARAEVIDATIHHRIDLGLVHAPVTDRDLHIETIGESEIVAVVPRGHPLAGYEFVTPRDLDDQPLISLDPATPASHLVRECFEAAGIDMNVVMEANSSTVAYAAVANSGRCVALIDPWPSGVAHDHRCVLVRFRPTVPQRVALLRSAFRPPSRLAELIAEELRLQLIKSAGIVPFVKGMATST
ncbi:LysR substrate-binding domain-containing protein [Reyranella sp. CPCC 100927]|uniref:LysR family transcriptional regulator n=1 Tax=Reyranella sp. CPCC 100927 TaxID=2599616 RepID=UPI0011B4D549|nr:LysR substrate-binding domain-containing protein [Reyranella sp. CPCC 100927]TWS95691.1 LysR family transcriptional regulator [Reyranella sp. CPCC 100927]